jgi:endo-1,4-beta-mannosidase
LNYLITGSVNLNKIKFFSEWITRNDTRRKTSPEKNISEVLPLLPHHNKIQRTIMFDDTIKKIISDKKRDTIVEVPEYDTEVSYEALKKCWNTVIGTPFARPQELNDIDEDFTFLEQTLPSKDERIHQESITEEFMTKPLIKWLLRSSDDDTYD